MLRIECASATWFALHEKLSKKKLKSVRLCEDVSRPKRALLRGMADVDHNGAAISAARALACSKPNGPTKALTSC